MVIQKNQFENVVCKTVAIFSRFDCDNQTETKQTPNPVVLPLSERREIDLHTKHNNVSAAHMRFHVLEHKKINTPSMIVASETKRQSPPWRWYPR